MMTIDILSSYELSDGQKRAEKGILKNASAKAGAQLEKDQKQFSAITGSNEFIGTDGVIYKTEFVADEVMFMMQLTISSSRFIILMMFSEWLPP